MIRRLIILLLIVGCDNSTAPEPEDCAGVAGGTAVEDICGVCDSDTTNDCTADCDGVYGGTAIEDIDGNCYATVLIGDQLWMAENLKTTHYNNGDTITIINQYNWEDYIEWDVSNVWGTITAGGYSMPAGIVSGYNDALGNYIDVFGLSYNWGSIMDNRGVCPEDFHIPSDNEWMELEMFLGMSEAAANSDDARGTNEGSKLAGNAMLWDTGNLIFNSYFATSGFNALPAATLWFDGEGFYDGGLFTRAYFWSSTENIYRAIWHNRSDIKRRVDVEESMLSIRCLKSAP